MNQLAFEFDPSPEQGKRADDTFVSKVAKLCADLQKFKVDIQNALAYSHGSYTYDDVCAGVLSGRFHFYPLDQSFLMMELQTGPQYSIYHAFLAGGDLDELMAAQDMIHKAAKELGAKYSTLNGRHGWTKPLKALGWEHRYSVLYKEV